MGAKSSKDGCGYTPVEDESSFKYSHRSGSLKSKDGSHINSTGSALRVWYRHTGEAEVSRVPRTKDTVFKTYNDWQEIQKEIGDHCITHMYIWSGVVPSFPDLAPKLEQLNIYGLTDSSQLDSLTELEHLHVLNLSDSNFSAGLPEVISQLTGLTQLYLNSCKLTNLPRRMKALNKLEVLSLEYNNFSKGIPPVISQLTTLRKLYLSGCLLTSLPQSLSQVTQLRLLKLSGNFFRKKLPSVVGELVNLQQLYAGSNEMQDLPNNLAALTQLEVLSLNTCSFSQGIPPVIGQLCSLRKLFLKNNNLRDLPSSFSALKKLEFLALNRNIFSSGLPSVIEKLQSLRELQLDRCLLKDMPNGLEGHDKLKCLYLKDNHFRSVPEVLYKLKALETLDLSHNVWLRTIDDAIALLPNLTKLLVQRCDRLEYPPYAVCRQGLSAIKTYFTDLHTAAGSAVAAIPVAIVGNPLSGKTSIVRSLQTSKRCLTFRQESSLLDEATKVFKIEDLDLQSSQVKLIDYGGHEVYHMAYQLIIQERCLPLIVVNMQEFSQLLSHRGPHEATKRVCFDWLSHLYLACPRLGSPLLVLTHLDQLQDGEADLLTSLLLETSESLRAELLEEESQYSSDFKGGLREISYLFDVDQAMFNTEEIFTFDNDLDQASNIACLKTQIDSRCTAFQIVIPHSWALLAEFIEREGDQPYLLLSSIQSEFESLDCFVILRYMHNAGKILWFENLTGLSQYIFHRISEITDMIAVLFHHASEDLWKEDVAKFTMFSHKGQVIRKHKYETLIQNLSESGMLDEALLAHLLHCHTQFPFDVALQLLKCFYIVHGPIKKDDRETYVVPYFAHNFLDKSWKTDGDIQLRLDIVLAGLTLPKYVYQLMSVAVLNSNLEQFDTLIVAKNGVTVQQEVCATHMVHNYNTKKVTLQVSTSVELLAVSWNRLIITAKKVIQLLFRVWKASHVEVLVYCAHCLFVRDPNPSFEVDPDWFLPIEEVNEVTTFAGTELLACRRCATSGAKVIKRTVPKPLKLPCFQLHKDEVEMLKSYLADLKTQRYDCYEEVFRKVDGPDGNGDETDSDLSDVEEEGYCDHSSPVQMSMRLAIVRKASIKQLYYDTEKVYQMSDRCRGRVLIINIHTFRDTQQTRAGSQVDYDNISRLFKDMKFDIAKSRPELTDLTAQEIYKEVREETKREEHSAFGMFVLVIMSHGARGHVIIDCDSQPVDLIAIKDLLSPRNFPRMKGKPKLIIVQACSGDRADFGDQEAPPVVDAEPQATTQSHNFSSQDFAPESMAVPVASATLNTLNADDFFIMKASSESFLAIRSRTHGSWFIRVLVATFYKHSCHRDVESLFKIVQERVRKASVRENSYLGGSVPTSVCTFTNYRKLYFFPGFPAR
ncbi:malignant fibrous histiocytoma-amplified sequence 1-like [Watersipora subatra]|uniref:malignant fibrous histiocytoma-amplified sequence 1-like n=1 Tax=Watersipora subatra TaxID=2589382 RepID=UPI00355C712E